MNQYIQILTVFFLTCVDVFYILTEMDLKISATKKGKWSLIHDGYTYRVNYMYQSKTGGTTWRHTNKACKAVVKTGAEEDSLIPVNLEHNHQLNNVKIERQHLRVSVWCNCHIRNLRKSSIVFGASEKINWRRSHIVSYCHMQNTELKVSYFNEAAS